MARDPDTKKLLVEGKDDQYAIAELMGHHTPWDAWPVDIHPVGGVEQMLTEKVIDAHLRASNAKTCGIVIDANDNFASRWEQIRRCCLGQFPDLPDTLSPEGLIETNARKNRLGIWIMPDNQSAGLLETFLKYLVPNSNDALWYYACTTADEARTTHNAPYTANQMDKAHVHTWLAWQDPPGLPLGLALKSRIFSTRNKVAMAFVEWFCKLFELPRIREPQVDNA